MSELTNHRTGNGSVEDKDHSAQLDAIQQRALASRRQLSAPAEGTFPELRNRRSAKSDVSSTSSTSSTVVSISPNNGAA